MKIKNKNQLINNPKNKFLRKLRKDILSSLEKGINEVLPDNLIKKNLKLLKNNILKIGKDFKINLSLFKDIYVLGAGKATFKMAEALEEILKDRIKKGFVNVYELSKAKKSRLKYIIPNLASHPYPDKNGMMGAKKILSLAKLARKDDLVFVLISGGGSALLPLPADGITLRDKILMNKLLVQSSAKIEEINIVRKHISAIKGGFLARTIYPATAICLYLSDVVGDELSSIASGPCVGDKSTFFEAIKILKKYKLWGKTPFRIKKYLQQGIKNKILETPKPDDEIFKKGKFYHFILGKNKVVLETMARYLKKKNYEVRILTDRLEGEVHFLVDKFLEVIRRNITKRNKHYLPKILLFGGEMTLILTGKGMGGRNQELAMIMSKHIPENTVFISFNTDGVDGRTEEEVGGGIVDNESFLRARKLRIKVADYIENNESYLYLKKIKETIITGKTGTNVGDVIAVGIG